MSTAIITGADGGMGREITRAVALAGWHVVMACCRVERATKTCEALRAETGNAAIEVRRIDLRDLSSVRAFADGVRERGETVGLLMNNAGILARRRETTADGLESTVSVNYVGPALLTRLLVPYMKRGARIVSMVSCTYAIGRLSFPDFFTRGGKGAFWRIPVYSNTKLALTLFTLDMARRLREKGITVNCADPGVVSTDIIRMGMWFDPLTDIFFRPFIRTPRQGAATAVHLLLSPDVEGLTGRMWASCKPRTLARRITEHKKMKELMERTEAILNA